MALADDLLEYWPLVTNDLVGAVNSITLTANNMSFEAASPGPAWKPGTGGGVLYASGMGITEPCTIAAQVYSGGSGANTLLGHVVFASDRYREVRQESTGPTVGVRARRGGTIADVVGPGITINSFNNVAGVFDSTTARRAWADGSFGSDNTTSVDASGGIDILCVGGLWDGSSIYGDLPSTNFRFKNLAVWNRSLSDAELDSYFADPSQLESAGGGFTLTAEQGSYSLTGQTAGLFVARGVSAAQGSYSLAGQDVTFTKETPGAFTLTAGYGEYAWTGEAALADYAMNASSGIYGVTGQEVTFGRGYPQAYALTAAQGLYALTGRSARLVWSGAPIVPSSSTGLNLGMSIGL